MWCIWGSYYNVPKAIFYLLKGDYNALIRPFFERGESARCSVCNRCNVNLSKLVLKACEGSADGGVQSGSKRASVQLESLCNLGFRV